MLSQDRIMGVKEAADYLGVSTQAFSNLRSRYKEDFPEPVVTLTATPIFDKIDIERWADAHNRTYKATASISSWGKYKSVAFCGRPRVGKSFLASLFFDDPYAYRAGCSQHGDDFTQCAVQHYVSDDIVEEFAIFHNKRKDDHTADIDGMDGVSCPIQDEKFPTFMKDVSDYLKSKREAGEQIDNEVYIEIYMRPSQMARTIMNKCNVKTLIITDTPGVSKNYSLVPIEKADLVILVAGDSNRTEARESYKELVRELAPLIASSRMCFMYRINSACDDEEEYSEIQEEARNAMKSFSDDFAELRKSIIDSSMEILQPAKTVIGIPSMKPKKKSIAENYFIEHITGKISELLESEIVTVTDIGKEVNQAKVSKEELVSFVLLRKWNFENLDKEVENEYTLEDFKKAHHDRVMSGDNYRLLYSANMACRKQLQNIYNEFSQYNDSNCPEMWKQVIIKYVYSQITTSIKTDIGISEGTHQFEAYPPVTMYAIESILAKDILEGVIEDTEHSKVIKYIGVLREYDVTSNSWGYVNVNMNNKEAILKIKLIEKCKLNEIKVADANDLVWSRYTLGLQKIAEYHVWKELLKIVGTQENMLANEIETIMFEE